MFALLPIPALAQILPTGAPAADILLTRALSEQRVFLTCSALDAGPHGYIAEAWAKDVAAATAILRGHKVPPEAVAAFAAAAESEALMPEGGTPFAEVREFCAANADWPERYARLTFTVLAMKLPAAFD